jgi:signal transduction histidine kinase
LTAASEELRQISRGIHPAILAKGGLGPALKTLARRCPVPVTLDVAIERRLPESVEVAAYYVVAEALTNTAKYAQPSEVTVCATVRDAALCLSITDDGIGGADSRNGSGLIGLTDRIGALGGRLQITSPLEVARRCTPPSHWHETCQHNKQAHAEGEVHPTDDPPSPEIPTGATNQPVPTTQ